MSILDQFKSTPTGHSATVTMLLHVGTTSLRVLQSSKEAIKLQSTANVPLGDALLETIVDGRSHKRLIRVLEGGPRPNWVSIVDR